MLVTFKTITQQQFQLELEEGITVSVRFEYPSSYAF